MDLSLLKKSPLEIRKQTMQKYYNQFKAKQNLQNLKNNLLYGHKNNLLNCGMILGNMNTGGYRSSAAFSDYSNLIAYYKFNEASGNIINVCDTTPSTDCLGSNDDLVVTGATYGATGKIGDALSFDGSNDYAEAANMSNSGFSGQNKISVNAWVKQDVIDTQSGIFECLGADDDDSGLMWVHWSDGKAYVYAMDGASFQYGILDDYSLHMSAATWTMVTYVYDGTQTGNANRLKIYYDGSNVAFNSFNNNIPSALPTMTNRPYRVGRGSSGSFPVYWNGDIDEMSVWQRALSASEVSELYNSGSGLEL